MQMYAMNISMQRRCIIQILSTIYFSNNAWLNAYVN